MSAVTMSGEQPRPSVRDVAKAAGVSVGTVSHVLNHPERVSEETRQRVHDAVTSLGFVRSASARQLRQGTSTTVGVIILDFTNPFFMEAAQGIDQRLQCDGCIMTIASSNGEPRRQLELLRIYESMQARGIILTPCGTQSPAVVEELDRVIHKLKVPVVLFDHPAIITGIPTVDVDDVTGQSHAINHLLELGHRRIGFINGPFSVRQAVDRWDGACHAVRAYGLDPEDVLTLQTASAFTAAGGAEAAQVLLDTSSDTNDSPVTAFACANDVLAIGAMRVLRARNIPIPQGMAITGYDDIQVAAELITPLTSVRQPMREMGWHAADNLLAAVQNPDTPYTELFQPELSIRESTAGHC